jgi:hypothetical protein
MFMKKMSWRTVRFSLAIAVAFVTFASGREVSACGDKYIRLAARLGPAYKAAHHAAVLIYMPQDSVVPAAARKLRLQDSLRRAGHRVEAVDRKADFETALRTRTYDVVLADAAAAGALAPTLLAAPGRPTMIPVFHNRSHELDEARKQSRCLIASNDRVYHAVAEIDHVLELRQAARTIP